MPTVIPRYRRQGGLKPLPGARLQSAETFESRGGGAALAKGRMYESAAQALGTGVKEVTDLVTQQRQRANDIANLEAENEASRVTNDILWGDNGVLKRQGKDVMSAPEEVAQAWKEAAGKIGAKMGTPEQRLRWSLYSEKAYTDLSLVVQRHVAKEVDAYETGELVASLQNRSSIAMASWQDHETVSRNIVEGYQRINVHGKSLGWGDEKLAAARLAFASPIHESVANQMAANGLTAEAKTYVEEAGADISGDAQARLANTFKESSSREEAQAAFDKLRTSGLTSAEQREKAMKDYKGPLRDDVLRLIEHEKNVKDDQKRDLTEADITAAKAAIDKDESGRGVFAVDPALMGRLIEGGYGSAIRDYATNRNQRKDTETDETAYAQLVEQAFSTDPEARALFARQVLPMGKLSKGDHRYLHGLQLKIRGGEELPADTRTVTEGAIGQMVTDALTGIGLDPTPPAPGTKKTAQSAGYKPEVTEAVNLLRRRVREDVGRMENPTTDQVQATVDRWRMVLQRELNDTENDLPLLTRLQRLSQRADIYLPREKPLRLEEIPMPDREAIEANLRKRGLAVTPSAIIDAYRLRVRR